MEGTTAVKLDQLGYSCDATEQPLCPACNGGRLHPYAVTFTFPMVIRGLHYTSERVDYLEGWVAVCVGNKAAIQATTERLAGYVTDDDPYEPEAEVPPCGFTMNLTPKQHRGIQP